MKVKHSLLVVVAILHNSCEKKIEKKVGSEIPKKSKSEIVKTDEKIVTINQITTDYNTMINNINFKGDVDSYDEMYYGFMDANEIERTDSVLKYSKIMALKYNYEKAYFDYFKALLEKNNTIANFSNYAKIDISKIKGNSKIETLKWLKLMQKNKIITKGNYEQIKKYQI